MHKIGLVGCGKWEEIVINEKELIPVKLINTHCHIDHILGNKFVSEKWGLQLYMHKTDFVKHN